ncbi:MAG TPA: ATPase, T2SS/T4P/T4SS family [Patescibacteria group bacterium]|nr:ATPase, T2SS/T4P/T4SS family [Patescibacteria group bacterium]
MLPDKQLLKILAKTKIIPAATVTQAQTDAQEQNKHLDAFILEKKILEEEPLFQAIAKYYSVPFTDLKNRVIRKDILEIIPEPIAENHHIIAFDKDEQNVSVATLDPEDLETLGFIRKKVGIELKVHVTTPTGLRDGMKQYHKGLKAEFKEITEDTKEGEAAKDESKDLQELARDLPIVRIVDTLLEYAILEGASDIHIEPTEKSVIVRYRIDGVLKDVMTLPKTAQTGIAARIKILSNLKIDEHRVPQDGRFKISQGEYKVAFRVSTLPVFDGEKIVMRVLNESAEVMTLEQLGMQKGPLEILKRNIHRPHGMILVTGPTGSGKTTTLYTIVNILNTPKVNISTVEDPIEYRMPRINQSQVNPKIGFTFAGGLRALLRQDPNIIMVGEIRDAETGEIGVHAAMTGHLVLSTLHTNDAVTAIPRFIEMGIPTFLIASTVNLVVAQRLVRIICPHCITSYNLPTKMIEELEKQMNVKEILEVLEREGVITDKETKLGELLFYRGKGCNKCNMEGYKGRMGVYEVLEMTKQMQELVLVKASAEKFRELAAKNKMITMLQDGMIKAKNGITSIEEVLRVTKE